MEHWTAEHCAFVIEVYFKGHDNVQRKFRQQFNIGRHGRVPERHTIRRWVDQFCATASAMNKTPLGKPRTVLMPEDIKRVWNAIDRSPRHSVNKHTTVLHLSDRSVCRLLYSDLSYHPYKMQVTHMLFGRQ